MTDWLALCRAAAAEVEGVLAELPTRDERERVVGAGEGGDDTTAIDDAAERAVVALLDSPGRRLRARERGARPPRGRADGAVTVVLDPIDGSINAKRGIPFFSLSLAVAEGPTMADVVFGFVHDFGSGEEWSAVRGEGARLDGAPLDAPLPKESIELLGLEATKTALVAEHAPALTPIAERLRVMGSLALSLCHLAAGRVDAVASLRPARSVDIAAAQLVALERGVAVELFDEPPLAAAPLDLVPRSRLAAAATPEAPARGSPTRCARHTILDHADEACGSRPRPARGPARRRCRRHQGHAQGARDGAEGQRQVALLDQGHGSQGQAVRATVTAVVIDPLGTVHPVDYGPTGPPNPGPRKPVTNWPFKGTFRDYMIFPPDARLATQLGGLTLRWTVKAKIGGKTYKKILKRLVKPQ